MLKLVPSMLCVLFYFRLREENFDLQEELIEFQTQENRVVRVLVIIWVAAAATIFVSMMVSRKNVEYFGVPRWYISKVEIIYPLLPPLRINLHD